MRLLATLAWTYLFAGVVWAGVAYANAVPFSLEERNSTLRARVVELATQQAHAISRKWDPGQRDCAGFIRFLFSQAVTGKAQMWRDRTGEFVNFVRAGELVAYNFQDMGRTIVPNELKTGDVLLYYNDRKHSDDAWHTMVILEAPAGKGDKHLVMYHNGASGQAAAIRRLWLDTLYEPAWAKWRPAGGNYHFKGWFRWHGWDQPTAEWTHDRSQEKS